MHARPFQRALVLGATGMIGAHAVRSCLARGIAVRALVRPTSERRLLEQLAQESQASGAPGIEYAVGDLGDPASLTRALEGCDLAIHAAAPYPRKHFGKKAFLEAAAHGMRNFLDAARATVGAETEALDSATPGTRAGATDALARGAAASTLRRIVYVSSSTTIGLSPTPGRPANEDDLSRVPDDSPYFAVKFLLEDMASDAARAGLPVVIVNPTLCVDEYDDHRTTAMLLIPLARNKLPAFLKGVVNAVATRDVGEGILLAALRGRPGRRYILGGENLSTRGLLERCAKVAGVKPPRMTMPIGLAQPISMATELLARLTGTFPLFPMSGVRMSRWSQPYSIERAREELGYAPTPLDPAIERAYAWYRARGWL